MSCVPRRLAFINDNVISLSSSSETSCQSLSASSTRIRRLPSSLENQQASHRTTQQQQSGAWAGISGAQAFPTRTPRPTPALQRLMARAPTETPHCAARAIHALVEPSRAGSALRCTWHSSLRRQPHFHPQRPMQLWRQPTMRTAYTGVQHRAPELSPRACERQLPFHLDRHFRPMGALRPRPNPMAHDRRSVASVW